MIRDRIMRPWVILTWSVIAILAISLAHGVLAEELRVFDLTVKERQIAVPGNTIRVEEGDRVDLRITSDETGELHLHGYDVTIELQAGKTTVTAVQAEVAGRFRERGSPAKEARLNEDCRT